MNSRLPPRSAFRVPGQDGQRKAVRPNSVGLTNKQIDAIMSNSEGQGGAGGKPDRRRKFVRWAFRYASLEVQILQPGGSANSCRVACRNLSCGGMSIVHNAFVYPGSPCVAHLPRPGGSVNSVAGVIVRCIHVHGMVHEIGIRFNTSIIAAEYVDHDPMAGQFSLEVVEPEALTGTLLCVEDSRLDQKLVQHYLRGTSIRLRVAENAGQAAEIARDGFDLVLCDYHVGTEGAEKVVSAIRDVLPEVPVIIVTADSSAATLESIRRLPVNAFLAKPFTDSMLQRALGEFLIAARGAALAPKDGIATELAADVAANMADFQRKFEGALKENDPTGCYVLCQQLGATAHSLKLHSLARLAQEASASLAATMSIRESEKWVRELMAACGKRAAA